MPGDPDRKLHFFGTNLQQDPTSVEEAGNKGFNLMKMARIGLPVPPGFVVGTSFCAEYLRDHSMPAGLIGLIQSGVKELERATGLGFGSPRRPMLLSVRSGAAVSMPGMMETILDLGLCDSTMGGLVRQTGNPRFAWDSYRRLIQTYAEVVEGCSGRRFEKLERESLASERVDSVRELDSELLKALSSGYLQAYEKEAGAPFPQDPVVQLAGATEAVFRSWESGRAVEFRRIHNIKGLPGTAVVVQLMVFGNMGGTSGSGVGFTRDPATGENLPYIDFLFNAQGEDVVSGRHSVRSSERLSQSLPGIYQELQTMRSRLESEFKDMQDFEFTVQEGRLYMLQCRRGNRTPWAALQIAVDLVNEGVIDRATALKNLGAYDLSKISRTVVSSQSGVPPLSRGVPASVGVAVGTIALHAKAKPEGAQILVRRDISTEDIAGMAACAGIVTTAGGRTSHAAVVARQMNKVCVVGCSEMSIDLESGTVSFGRRSLREGEIISLDGNSGCVYEGEVSLTTERPTPLLETVAGWKAKEAALLGKA